jgi:hypothetical protein
VAHEQVPVPAGAFDAFELLSRARISGTSPIRSQYAGEIVTLLVCTGGPRHREVGRRESLSRADDRRARADAVAPLAQGPLTYLEVPMNAVVLWMLVMQLGQEVPAGNPQVILVQDIVSKEACERLGQTMLQRLKVSQTIAFCAPVEKSQPK